MVGRVAHILIRQFDICELRRTRGGMRLVVVLQHDELSDVATVLVAPLVEGLAPENRPRLHPVAEFGGRRYHLMVERLAAIERKALGPVVGSCKDVSDAIKRAIDIAFLGF